MLLTITDEAKVQIDKMKKTDEYLLLWYDITDCGCGVNGMPTFQFTNEKKDIHVDVECETYPTIISKQHQTFFSKQVKIDFIKGMFRLTSPEGILNPFISIRSVKAA